MEEGRGRGGGYRGFGKRDQLHIQLLHQSFLLWNEFVFFEITNKFLFYFQ